MPLFEVQMKMQWKEKREIHKFMETEQYTQKFEVKNEKLIFYLKPYQQTILSFLVYLKITGEWINAIKFIYLFRNLKDFILFLILFLFHSYSSSTFTSSFSFSLNAIRIDFLFSVRNMNQKKWNEVEE